MAQDFGTVEFNGKIYKLTQQAYCDNVGTSGEVAYYASAEDEEGNEFKAVWETTLAWDLSGELFNLEQAKEEGHDFSEEDAERLEELSEDYDSSLIQDESDACDWENPADVYEI